MGRKAFLLIGCGFFFPAVNAVAAVSTGPVVSISTYGITMSSFTTGISSVTWRPRYNAAFREGESFHYVVRWGIIKGGISSLQVKGIDPIGDRMGYHIVSEANSAGIVDTFYKTHDLNETWLDTESLATLRFEKHIREGRYKVEQVIDIDQVNHRFKDSIERLDKGTTAYVEGSVTPYVMDVLGSLYYVRTLPFNEGESYIFDIYDNKKIWPMVVKVLKRERIKVPAGRFDCFKVEPILREPGIFISKGKRLQVWLTADERRMPIMMRSEVAIGHVSAELVRYSVVESTVTPAAVAPAP